MTDLKMLKPGEGDHYWLLGVLATIKVGGEATDGAMTIAEFEAPPGWGVPPHRHIDQDELFYVLDGEVTFRCDDTEATYTRGGLAWLPRGRIHTFEISRAGPARLFNIHTGSLFENLVQDVGEIAPEARIPDSPDEAPDPRAIVEAFARYNIEIVGAPA
ncbi:MAG: cupin domain-containing protein [Acidimicrobiia bacterium]